MNFDDVRQELDRWPQAPRHVCLRIVDYLEATPPEKHERMTYRFLADLANGGELNHDLISATTILSATHFAPLDVRAVVIDEDGTEHALEASQMLAAMTANAVDHPVTGEETPLDRVLPYFVLSDRITRQS